MQLDTGLLFKIMNLPNYINQDKVNITKIKKLGQNQVLNISKFNGNLGYNESKGIYITNHGKSIMSPDFDIDTYDLKSKIEPDYYLISDVKKSELISETRWQGNDYIKRNRKGEYYTVPDSDFLAITRKTGSSGEVMMSIGYKLGIGLGYLSIFDSIFNINIQSEIKNFVSTQKSSDVYLYSINTFDFMKSIIRSYQAIRSDKDIVSYGFKVEFDIDHS